MSLYIRDRAASFHLVRADLGGEAAEAGSNGVGAPVTGTLVTLLRKPGERMNKGDGLTVMTAMKMEHTIRAPAAG